MYMKPSLELRTNFTAFGTIVRKDALIGVTLSHLRQFLIPFLQQG